MYNIFLDLGTHNGQSMIKGIEKFPNCDMYIGFEPLPQMKNIIEAKIPEAYKKKVVIYTMAVDALGDEPFTHTVFIEDSAQQGIGSTLLRDKRLIGKGSKINVVVRNIVHFFQEMFTDEDKVILKIDIEGKEYDVFDALIESELLQRNVIKIFAEWHSHKTKTISQERHDKTVKKLNELGYKLKGTKADEFCRKAV